MSKLICIDPGHGGKDPGAVGFGRKESVEVLRLSLEVEKKLKRQGLNTHMIRSKDEYVELYSRPKTSDKIGADMLVSIHKNAFAQTSAKGVEIWVHTNGTAADISLASTILSNFIKTGVQANRGVKKGAYVVLGCKATAIMIELGFITNKVDNELFDKNFNAYADDIARGICTELGIPYNSENPKQYARIQTGAYTYPNNETGARQTLDKIQQLGREMDIPELENAFLVIPSAEKAEKE